MYCMSSLTDFMQWLWLCYAPKTSDQILEPWTMPPEHQWDSKVINGAGINLFHTKLGKAFLYRPPFECKGIYKNWPQSCFTWIPPACSYPNHGRIQTWLQGSSPSSFWSVRPYFTASAATHENHINKSINILLQQMCWWCSDHKVKRLQSTEMTEMSGVMWTPVSVTAGDSRVCDPPLKPHLLWPSRHFHLSTQQCLRQLKFL